MPVGTDFSRDDRARLNSDYWLIFVSHLLFRRLLLLFFWPLTALILFLDSRSFGGETATGQWISNAITPLYLAAVMSQLKPRQQLILALFVPISALGEGLFSLIFGLYRYRLGMVPLYVPFGHSILLGTAWIFAEESWLVNRERLTKIGLVGFHAGLIFGSLVLFRDVLSFLWGLMFCVVWTRKGSSSVFLIVGVLVLYVELVGTACGCWRWQPLAFGAIPTFNPPVGAFACYILGELAAIRAAQSVSPRLKTRLRWNQRS